MISKLRSNRLAAFLSVVPAMRQQPSQVLNGFLGPSVLRFAGQFTPQIIETFVHQLHDMKAVESQNRVWRVGSHAAGICSAHVHGHRFEPSSAELEAAPELTQSLGPAAFPHPHDTSALHVHDQRDVFCACAPDRVHQWRSAHPAVSDAPIVLFQTPFHYCIS